MARARRLLGICWLNRSTGRRARWPVVCIAKDPLAASTRGWKGRGGGRRDILRLAGKGPEGDQGWPAGDANPKEAETSGT